MTKYFDNENEILFFCRILNFSGEENETGEAILDVEQEWLITAELRMDHHHPEICLK